MVAMDKLNKTQAETHVTEGKISFYNDGKEETRREGSEEKQHHQPPKPPSLPPLHQTTTPKHHQESGTRLISGDGTTRAHTARGTRTQPNPHDPPTPLRSSNSKRAETRERESSRLSSCFVGRRHVSSRNQSLFLGGQDCDQHTGRREGGVSDEWTRREFEEERARETRRTLGLLLDGFENLHGAEEGFIDGHCEEGTQVK